MEVCSTVTTRKLASMGRVILFTIQKVSEGFTTTLDLHLLVKRGKILRKSLNDAVSVSHSRLTCRPNDDPNLSFFSPVPILEYEFSCSSTPPRRSYTPTFHVSSNRRRSSEHKPFGKRHVYLRYNTLPKIHDRRHVAEAGSSSAGGSTTDSRHVDRAAEEFIQRFYRQLRLQKWMSQELY